MSILHLHKDVAAKGYLSGVLTSLKERARLVHDFAAGYGYGIRYGWSDLDPHVMDVAVDGRPVAQIEAHHDRHDISVFNEHPEADKFVAKALRHGYEPDEPQH